MPDPPTPLQKKLGLKPGMRVLFVDPPSHYARLIGALPAGVDVRPAPEAGLDFVHAFCTEADALDVLFPMLKAHLAERGTLWISWPKKTSPLSASLDGNGVREIGLRHGLVDVKVCAVDADWSGLKFVYRTKDRSRIRPT